METIQIKRYPEGMKGIDLRRQLGIKEKPEDEKEFRRKRAKFFKMADGVLRKFWSKFNKIKLPAEKLALLREMALVALSNPLAYEKRRKAHGYRKGRGRCRVCSDFAFNSHHIIQVKNGGHNKSSNILLLCEACHRAIHPWMPTHLPLEEDMKQTMQRVEREV